jgi:hypothetical protein
MQGVNEGNQITGTAHRERTSMIDAVRGYFTARIAASEVALKESIANSSEAMEAKKANQAADLADVENYIQAFDGELKGLMAASVALLNNVRASGGVQYNVAI